MRIEFVTFLQVFVQFLVNDKITALMLFSLQMTI